MKKFKNEDKIIETVNESSISEDLAYKWVKIVVDRLDSHKIDFKKEDFNNLKSKSLV